MALGDSAGLQAVQAAVAQIPGLEAFLGDKVNDLHAALAQTLTDGISQAGATLLKVEQPVLERMDAGVNESKHWRAILFHGFEGNIGGMPFRIKSMVPADPSIAPDNADPSQANSALPSAAIPQG